MNLMTNAICSRELKNVLLGTGIACALLSIPAHACKLGLEKMPGAASAAAATASAVLRSAAVDPNQMPIHAPTAVGLWRSEFLGADGSDDIGFDTFYADGNELLIDNAAPATDNVCSGVWEQVGPRTYKINHPSWYFDANGNLIGIVTLIETITVDRRGNQFSGTGTVTVYDPTLTTVVYQTTGTLTGVRITADSSPL